MGWLSVFKRRDERDSAAADAGDAVQVARIRARQRLIGAVVLVVIGVIGFPLVFETQPRPIPVDIPIDIPRKDGAPALALPAPRPATPSAPAEPPREDALTDKVITETRAEAGREVPVPAAASTPAKAASRPATKVAAAASTAAEAPRKPAAEPAATATPAATANADDATRAKALLDGKDPAGKDGAAKDTGRYIVQVGAFADAQAAREVRLKVEKLGLKTYTQVAETAQGSRIRVRVGPFASRDEADKALAKARSAGVAAVVLTL